MTHGALTPLKLPLCKKPLTQLLRQDWLKGIHNVNQLLAYTNQFIPIIQTFNRELTLLPPEQLIYRVSQLAEKPYDWELLRFSSASLTNVLKAEFLKNLFILPFRQRLASRLDTSLRFDTPAHATTAGFWLLHKRDPKAASQAFDVVKELPYGPEMHTLAISLALFEAAETVADIAAIEAPNYPPDPLLRPVTWKAMQRFCNVISDTKTVVGSVSRTSRAFASNRALGELKHILDYVDEVPEAERQLIENIAKQWRNALLDVATAVGEQTIEQPVQNPYVVGDPVEGSLFVGRDDILRQLEELWLMGRQMQSVGIYGHRRLG